LLSENICKSNIKSVLERCQRSTQLSRGENQDNNKIDLQAAKTWMISDKLAVFSSLENHQSFKSLKLDLQVQNEIESLIWQNLDKPANPNIFINKILTALTLESPVQNSVNSLVLNCYFDRLGSSSISILLD
jgi:GH18 family chitinase